MIVALLFAGAASMAQPPDPSGEWRAALRLAGGELRFGVRVEAASGGYRGDLCNGRQCQSFSAVRVSGDSVVFEIADYAATIVARARGDSLTGSYRNVGNRGPRTIPFVAARGRWPTAPGSAALLGRWDATMHNELGTSPRVFEFRNGPAGLEGTIVSNSGDLGHFGGAARADSFALTRFDGSYVYMLTGRMKGDSLVGVFHAGLRTQTPFTAVRSTGAPHLKAPTEITQADTSRPFEFAFPDLNGRTVSSADERFRGKVVLVDVFGTWCPTCHEAAPLLVSLHRKYRDQGLEVVGLAYEVTGDSAVDGALVRRYRAKFGIEFPLLLAGINDTEAAAETLPQLRGFTSFPTTIFLDRRGKVRRIHAGFHGPATGAQHEQVVREFHAEVERLLREK